MIGKADELLIFGEISEDIKIEMEIAKELNKKSGILT